ncbi:MAG: (d)CMP kinase [Chitinispirillia bacterium]|nr:(d)CMP kinase [Chitinispirillia bacterium]MCL2267615.1 (d)CMP kinase [Chitinispirillia bacterium]
MIIAIDGPAGSGKSSTAKAVAARLGITYLDTGAMYRAVTLKAQRLKIRYDDDTALGIIMAHTTIAFEGLPPDVRVIMDGDDVSADIRSDAVTKSVSDYCARDVVRKFLVEQQRQAAQGRSVVCEGRDIGTVVFPDADVKIFMVASVEERARRRQKDFAAMGVSKSVEELIKDIEARDHKDSTRANSPLTKAGGAIEMDTTGMTLEDQIMFIVNKVKT